MFRRYPYWGWLLLSIALWCFNWYDFSMHRQALLPDRMAHDVNRDLKHRNDVCEGFMLEHDIIRRMFSDSLTLKEAGRINGFPFYIFAYQQDSLKSWNTNAVIPHFDSLAISKPVILRNDKGVFISKSIYPFPADSNKRLVILLPVIITYPVENEYLRSHFAASAYIPVKTKIITPSARAQGDFPVLIQGSDPVFYLRFNYTEIEKWSPDSPFFIFLLLALLASMSWIQLMTIYHTRKRSPFAGFIITLSIISVLRCALYYGLPFNLDTLTFFSPLLYASSKYLSSLGDLCINTFCLLWMVVFITRNTPYKKYFNKVKGKWPRFIISMALMLVLVAYVFLFVNIIGSLVHDSSISFNVGHFYTINVYTITGLFVIGTITGLSCLIIYLFNIQFRTLLPNVWAKYMLMAVIATCYIFAAGSYTGVFYWGLMGWLLLCIVALDVPGFPLVSDLFEPHMIFWAVFICAFCTVILQYFILEKEHDTRKAFAQQKFSPDREYFLESYFDRNILKMQKDKQLKEFLYKPSYASRKTEDKRIDSLYLTGPISKYDLKVYLFDRKKNPLFNKDNISYNALENEKNESATTNSSYLFYNESILERHYYLAYIPIYNDTINDIAGYVVINMEQKKQVAGTVYPELLQPQSNSTEIENTEYAYAAYANGKLIRQTNDTYPFTTYLKNDQLKKQQFKFYRNGNITELYYNIGDKRTIVVVHIQSQLIETVTLFSYIFGMQLLLAVIILLYQLYISYFSGSLSGGKFIRLTLRKRVHFAMLAVEMLSFVIIGSVTILFITNQTKSTNEGKLQSTLISTKQSVQDYLKHANAYNSEYMFDTICASPRFKEVLTNIATGQKIDINVFNHNGDLLSASQDEIYNKGLISRKIRPDAFYQLNDAGKSIVIQNENVAGLSYLSAYEPLRDENGASLGYINVPFFSSEKSLNFQISNIVVTLINLYAFIFLLSSLIAVFITGWITRTFNVIIKQFGSLNLQRNERITWPYEDEVGLLVSEYNKMVNKVEENAAKLAQSERERAWREMARQVAHEIKNPLTPMKLNIQYLQQAMKNDHPNIKELTNKVADSIVEQINNLSYIASEFSNFAKMPEAKAEEIEIASLLYKATGLYLSDAHIKVTINDSDKNVCVLSDHSQLLRVLTNLIENAVQAIPDDRTANIEVALKRDGAGYALVTVADNGNGIPDDMASNIFQPYFTTKSSGTGLGLAMTRKIIEFWKGQIWFETKEGSGTTFYIRLPLINNA